MSHGDEEHPPPGKHAHATGSDGVGRAGSEALSQSTEVRERLRAEGERLRERLRAEGERERERERERREGERLKEKEKQRDGAERERVRERERERERLRHREGERERAEAEQHRQESEHNRHNNRHADKGAPRGEADDGKVEESRSYGAGDLAALAKLNERLVGAWDEHFSQKLIIEVLLSVSVSLWFLFLYVSCFAVVPVSRCFLRRITVPVPELGECVSH
jgi:hypothetical protein